MQYMVIDVTYVLHFPVTVVCFVLKNEHGHGTVAVIPFAPGDVESRRVIKYVKFYHPWW